jgi:hypothetical protein
MAMATQKQRQAAKQNVRKARRLDIPGRSRMGKAELKRAVARARQEADHGPV